MRNIFSTLWYDFNFVQETVRCPVVLLISFYLAHLWEHWSGEEKCFLIWSCQDRHNEGSDQNMMVQIKIWSVLDAILQMILYRIVIYSSLVEQRGRDEMCVWHFRHGMEGYLLYRNAISSLFAWFYAEDRLQLPSWPLNLAHLWEEQVGRTILWPLGISFTSEVRNVLFCLYYDQSQIVTLTALIRNI